MDVVRHYTSLSQKNFSIDTHFYPLGSCTMKHNPRACHSLASLPQFLSRHPLADAETGQGFLASMAELQDMLKEVTGMAAVSLAALRAESAFAKRERRAAAISMNAARPSKYQGETSLCLGQSSVMTRMANKKCEACLATRFQTCAS